MSHQTFSFGGVEGLTSAPLVVPARRSAKPEVHLISGTSDKAASVYAVRRGISEHTVVADADSPGTALTLDDVTGLSNGQVLVVQTAGGEVVARVTVAGIAGNVVTVSAVGVAVKAGSKVYRMQALTNLPCGDATKEYASPGEHAPLVVGRHGMPMDISLDGTSACELTLVSGVYRD